MAIVPDTIDTVVQDMSKTVAFYRLLGLAIPDGLENEQNVEITTANGYRLSWSTVALMVEHGGDKWANLPAQGRTRLSFRCDSPTEVDATYERMTAAGYTSANVPWDTFWGQRFAQVLDPDGGLVDIFAPLDAA